MINSASPSPSSPAPFPWAIVFLWALLPAMLLLAWHFPQPLIRAARAIAYSWQLDGEEGFLLDQALQLARGRGIYPPIAEEPYVVGNYPPVYPALWAALELASGRGGSLALGRLICLLSYGAIVVLAFFMTWRGTGRLALAPLAPLLFAVTYDWFDWIAYARVDIPAIAFAMGALAVIALSPPEKWARRAPWAAGLALLALFTKQTMLAAPLAIAVWLALRDRRALGRFALWLIAPGAAIFLLLTLLTGGGFFRHLITYNANKFAWFQVTAGLKHFWFFQKWGMIVLIAGIAGLIAILAGARRSANGAAAQPSRSSHGALCGVFAFFAAANLWAIGKEGSATNYLLEVHLAVALLIPAVIGALLAPFGEPENIRSAILARLSLGAMIVGLTIHGVVLLMPVAPGSNMAKAAIMFSRPTPTRADAERERAIEEEVARALALTGPGSILAEYPIYGLHLGERPVVQPFIMSQLAREEKWDPSPLIADIRNGRFRWLLVTQDLERAQAFYRWSPEFVEAFREVFVPRSRFARLEGSEQMFLYEFNNH